jgi:hypothetical protein
VNLPKKAIENQRFLDLCPGRYRLLYCKRRARCRRSPEDPLPDVEVAIAADLVIRAAADPNAYRRFAECVVSDPVVVSVDEDRCFVAIEHRVLTSGVVVAVNVNTVKNVRIEDSVSFDQSVLDRLIGALTTKIDIDLALPRLLPKTLTPLVSEKIIMLVAKSPQTVGVAHGE